MVEIAKSQLIQYHLINCNSLNQWLMVDDSSKLNDIAVLIHKCFPDNIFDGKYFFIRQFTKDLYQSLSINCSYLIQNNPPGFLLKLHLNPGWIFSRLCSHWSEGNCMQIPVHLIRRNDNAGSCFLYFAANSGIQVYKND